MATTAFPATAIFDSGATGRDLIQSANEAAAQAAIGIDPSDYGLLDSDNTWTGDNTFDEPITAPELAGVSSLMLTAGGGSPAYFKFGSTLSWIVDSTTIRPTDSLGSRDIGIYNRRIGDVMAYRFGATESMTIYKLGNETENTNTEYLETKWDSTKNSWVMRPKYSGSGTYRDFAIESSISNRAYIKFAIGGSSVALGYGYHNTGAVSSLQVGSSYIQIGKDMYPAASVVDTLNLGKTTNRWGLVASVDGDFSNVVKAGDGSVTAPSYSFNSQNTMGIFRGAINQINIVAGSSYGLNIQTGGMFASSNMMLGWRSGANISQGAAYDTYLARDATGIIAQRKPNQVQAFRVYGSYTDSSNGEWLQIDYGVSNAGVATIQAYANGTGVNGNLYIRSETNLRFYVGNILAHNISSTLDRMNVNLEPYFDNQKRLGSDVKRFTEVWSYAANFAGILTVDQIQNSLGAEGIKFDANYGYLTDSNGASNVLRWGTSGFEVYQDFKPRYDEQADFGEINRRWLSGFFVNLDLKTNFSLFNLGETGDTNTESLSLYSTSNVFYMYSAATGSGTLRDFKIGSGSTNIWFRNGLNAYIFTAGGSGKMEITTAGAILQSDLFPWVDNANLCGKTDKRWSAVNSHDADFIGTTTLRTFDDGAGNTSSVQTQNHTNDSFFLHRSWTGTSGGVSSWIGLKNDYNSSGTAASWIGLSSNTFRLEIGNGLRAIWQLTGNQHMLNMNIYPYTDNAWKNGTFNRAWSETWQHAAKTLGSYIDTSNYGYLSIEPDGDDYLIKANSLGTTADAGIKIQTSQKSAAGNQPIVFDADYNGQVSFYFGGNNRGFWSKDTLQPNVQVRTTVAYDINRIWNNATTVFEGYEANITDTTSDTESSLLNLKVGGTSYLRLRKDGKLLFEKNGGSAAIVQSVGGISIVGDNGSTVQAFDQYFNYTYKTFRPISDNQHLGYVSRRFLVKANDVYSKGKIRSYNLGDETEVNSEFLNMYWDADKAYLTVQKDGTGSEREFVVGHHTNGCTRYNNTSNIIRWSISGTTGTKMYLNSNGLTVYGRVDPQGNKTRDFGTDSTARWRVGYMDTCDLDDGRINQMTSSSSDPSTTEYANDGDWGVHKNTSSSTIYLACNSGGTIYKVALSGGTPPP